MWKASHGAHGASGVNTRFDTYCASYTHYDPIVISFWYTTILPFLRRWWPLVLVLLVGLVLRLALWEQLPRQGWISDEAEYLASASWLAQARFSWYDGWLWTRAPLYPLFVAVHLGLAGQSWSLLFAAQIGLSLLSVALIYGLCWRITGPPLSHKGPRAGGEGFHLPALLAGLAAALYLPFAVGSQLLLSETLYLVLILGMVLALQVWNDGYGWLILAAVLLGLACLTRGLTLGFIPLAGLWVWWTGRQRFYRRPLAAAAVFLLVCGLTIGPWSLYASRTYGGPILIDTTGSYNVMLGARTAYDDASSDKAVRQFALALLDEQLSPAEREALVQEACLWHAGDAALQQALATPVSNITQAQRQQLMLAEGLCLLRAAPLAFVGKSLSELVALFQMNYTGAERMSGGFSVGRLPYWYSLGLFLLEDTLYLLLLPLGIVGWAYARRVFVTSVTGLVGLWWLYHGLTAPLLFAINRFRLPLMPLVMVYAAIALTVLLRRHASAWDGPGGHSLR
ncbi:MAG: hypothetical protein HC837_20530 [Chloroflexaceae bacterium]|nr:hypothetical protein [Chloroflexaceae bacterium]